MPLKSHYTITPQNIIFYTLLASQGQLVNPDSSVPIVFDINFTLIGLHAKLSFLIMANHNTQSYYICPRIPNHRCCHLHNTVQYMVVLTYTIPKTE